MAPAPAPTRPKGRLLRLALIVIGFLAVVGGAVGFVVYDRVTAIDRSTPNISVQRFLTAVFVEAEPDRVQLFVCQGWDPTTAMNHARGLVDPQAKASWDTVTTVDQSGSQAHVDARIRLTYVGDIGPSGEEHWRFRLALQAGWRVCDVERSG